MAVFLLSLLIASLCAAASLHSTSPSWDYLQTRLSSEATIVHNTTGIPRWSEFHAPHSGTVVNVKIEKDVQETVQYCIENDIPFLAQNGGHGWATTFHLNKTGVIINMRGLNSTTFNEDRTEATIGGGAIISEVIEEAYANDAQVTTGNCNCVGALGAYLGGGYGNLMGLNGFGVDLIKSMNVVLANGELTTITSNDTDLWWALRGAGPNFGIVTSAVVQSTYVPQNESTAWLGGVTFTEDKLEDLIAALDKLVLEPRMVFFLYYITSYVETPSDNYTAEILFAPVYIGSEAEGRAAFKSILDIGPSSDGTAILPYTSWNAAANWFCTKGGRKPSYGVGFQNMVPETWRTIWEQYKEFIKTPGTGYSSVFVEAYPRSKPRSLPLDSASFANREINFNGVAIPWYNDSSLDASAEVFGSGVRDLFRETDGLPEDRAYINFAFGDDTLSAVYGNHTQRLQAIKKEYDPFNRFNQWFPLSNESQSSSRRGRGRDRGW